MKLKSSLLAALFLIFSFSIFAGEKEELLANHVEKLRVLSASLVELSEGREILAYEDSLNAQKTIFTYNKNFAEKIEKIVSKDLPLTGHQLNLIHESLRSFSIITENSLNISEKITISHPNRALHLKIKNLEDVKTIYDIYFLNKALRRMVKDQIKVPLYEISNIESQIKRILSKKYRKDLEKKIQAFISKNADINTVLKENIIATESYQLVSKGKNLKKLTSKSKFWRNFGDKTSRIIGGVTSTLSRGFGAAVGPIKWRSGHLKKNKEVRKFLSKTLKPLDLILEKKAFKFTDYTIPGYWGHVGIYLGTEAQLKELNLWNNPSIIPFHKKIQEGFSIYEVRREGLIFDTLDHWMDVDEMAIIRSKSFKNNSEKTNSLIFQRLFNQINKKYDFSFDAMSTEVITCTEIVSLSFGAIDWPTKIIAGRRTISPDNIAEFPLFENSPVEFVAYIKGNETEFTEVPVSEYAKKINYFVNEKRGSEENPSFDLKVRKCKKTRIKNRVGKNNGARRFKTECWDEFHKQEYKDPELF